MAGTITTIVTNKIVTGYRYTNDYTDSSGTHAATTVYDAKWNVVSSTLTTTKGSVISSSTWETNTASGIAHRETGYLNDGTVTKSWVYEFNASWHLTSKKYSEALTITSSTQTDIVDGVTGYKTIATNGTISHYDSAGLLTSYRIPYSPATDPKNVKTGVWTFDTAWHQLDDTWTNSDGSIVSQKTTYDSQWLITGYQQKGHNSANTSTWEYNFDKNWNLLSGHAVDGLLTTTYDPTPKNTPFIIHSQIADITTMTPVVIDGVSYRETITIDANNPKGVEDLYTLDGALYGHRINTDKTVGGETFEGRITFDPTWKNALNITETISKTTGTATKGDTISTDNATVNGVITHVQKGHNSTNTKTWEFHFSEALKEGNVVWNLTTGWQVDGILKTTFGKDFTVISKIADTSKLTAVTENGTVTGYVIDDNDTTRSFFDLKGTPTGHSTVSTVEESGIRSTTLTTYDADWTKLASSWTKSDGTSGVTEFTTDSNGKHFATETAHKSDVFGAMNWKYKFEISLDTSSNEVWNFVEGWSYDSVTQKMTKLAPGTAPTDKWIATEMTILYNDPAHPDVATGYQWTHPEADAQSGLHTTDIYGLDTFNFTLTGHSLPYAATEISGTTIGGHRTYDAYWTQVLDTKEVKGLDGSTYSEITSYASDGKTATGYEQIGQTIRNTSTYTSTFDNHFDASYKMVSGISVEGIVTKTLGSGGSVLSRNADTAKMTPILDISHKVVQYMNTDSTPNTTLYANATGAVIRYSVLDHTGTDTTGNITNVVYNHNSDYTTIYSREDISHNSTGSAWWDIVYNVVDSKDMYAGKWLDDGVTTKVFNSRDTQIGLIVNDGHAEVAHLQALQLIGIIA